MLHRRQHALKGRDPNPHRRRHPKQPRASTDPNTRKVRTGKTDRKNRSASEREKTPQYKRAVQAAKASQAPWKKGHEKRGHPQGAHETARHGSTARVKKKPTRRKHTALPPSSKGRRAKASGPWTVLQPEGDLAKHPRISRS